VGLQDFKFKNPYNTPLVISATYNDETKLYTITLTANVAEQTVNNVPRVESLGNQKYVVYLESYENDQLIETIQIGVSRYKGVYTD
jgi:vancomycin resistance protein YoaR